MKKILAFVLCLLIVIGQNNYHAILRAQSGNTSSSLVTPDFIDSLFLMKKNELLAFLGDGYTNVIVGSSDEEYDGYSYEEYGLTFVFAKNDGLAIIFPDENFDIYGAKEGMTLAEIQSILGDTEIKDSWYGVPDHYAYTVEYLIGKSKYEFKAVYEMDAPSFLRIYWGRDKHSFEDIEAILDMTKDEINKQLGEWVYSGDIVLGRKPEQVETGVDGHEGLYFSEWGFTFAFEDDAVAFIILDESVEVNKVGSGMTFFQIQTELGETEVYAKTKNTDDNSIEYSIEYVFNGIKYKFLSSKPGGNDSVLCVIKVVP